MYVPLHCHSDFSLLDGLSKPWQIAKRVFDIGATSCAITDHGNVSGALNFQKAMKDACGNCGLPKNRHDDNGKIRIKNIKCEGYKKGSLKAILGCEFYITEKDSTIKDQTNKKCNHLVVLAKNKDGWKKLIKAVSESNSKERYYYKPRIDIEKLAEISNKNFIVFSGHLGSDFANICFSNVKLAYNASSYEEARKYTKHWHLLKKELIDLSDKYINLFGKENFFLEIQLIDSVNIPATEIVAKTLRWLSKEKGIPCVATPDAHYPNKEDAVDQRVLLCSNLDTTLEEVERKIANQEDVMLAGFFKSNKYHIPSFEEMASIHTKEELENTIKIADMCENYDISSQPKLPIFNCPDDKNPDDYLKELCRIGWKKKVVGKVPKEKYGEYKERVEHELEVLKKAGLASYFLIVQDYVKYSQEVLKCKPSKGRGSAAGCLVSHLIGITNCDPIEYDLLFSRFYDDSRNTPDNISLPDIDCDFPVDKRDKIIEYIRNKYGESKTAQISTFSRMQGREVVTNVLKAHNWSSFEERKAVTQYIPDEAAISEQLQEMLEETGEISIVKWSLENNSKQLKPWVELKEDGSLEGPLSLYFEQAMRIEGVHKTQGKHAAGIIISNEDLSDIAPMSYDKSSNFLMLGVDLKTAEQMGLVKMDVLGLASLSKCQGVINILKTGKINNEND